ncbi:hypothetical protein GOV07_05720 [Candidatus Woesearchaeota archaeon]|nr:hypothetical protein [Candidatus Woesearchaeota archaeon]
MITSSRTASTWRSNRNRAKRQQPLTLRSQHSTRNDGDTSIQQVDATSSTYACDSSVDYWSTEVSCTYTRRHAECNGAGSCDTDASNYYRLYGTYNIPAGQVGENQYGGTDSTPHNMCSCSLYVSAGTSNRCSDPSDPDSGFGDREWTAYACDGSGGTSGVCSTTCTTNCGTGCCIDFGSTTACRTSGTSADDYWDFSTGDTSADDYCLSARVYDCLDTGDCEAGSYACTHNSCITDAGYFIVEDSGGNDMMIIDKEGKILLRGSLYENNAVTPAGNNDFIIDNGAGTERAYVDGVTGSLYLDGTVSENQGTLTPAGDNDFIIQDSGGTVRAYIEGTNGNLYTQSVVMENVIS